MSPDDQHALETVFAYHDRTKHHLRRYARSLGYMDWATQPDPFRTFDGADRLALDHATSSAEPSYDRLFGAQALPVQPVNSATVSRWLYDSLAISAWKQAPGTRPWSLRVNPSSGALHPTEGYLVTGPVPGLCTTAGVFHYNAYHHALERRRTLTDADWARLSREWSAPLLFVGLTSIYWRESWKYGERAFRYCHHDVGHAIGTVAFAARILGWQTRLIAAADPDDLALLLGIHTQSGIEAEHSDCLLALCPPQAIPPHTFTLPDELRERLRRTSVAGTPNRLSTDHHDWPVIDEVAEATRRPPIAADSPLDAAVHEPPHFPDRDLSAEEIIRRRRSAVDMDGETTMTRDGFYRILTRLVPHLSPWPFAALPWRPRLSLALFVHRVDDLPAGLYLLVRDPRHEAELRPLLDSRFRWEKPTGRPDELGLFLLVAGDSRRYAKLTSCHQDIAADGIFAVAMLAEFAANLQAEDPGAYRRLHWEAGLIGQVLYLEAEAAGIRGTGIGCFFDDATHDLLGLRGHAWQTLYHFAVGGPVEDPRLQTLAPYHHLPARR
jgi:SagB-type dehydrogenase family enzyme